MIRKIGIAIVLSFVFTACLKDKTIAPVVEPPVVDPCAETVSFSNEVLLEVLNVSCNVTGCHSAVSPAAGYTLVTHEQIVTNSAIMLKVMQHDPSVTPMPFGGTKLADSLIQKFECWIDQGMLDN